MAFRFPSGYGKFQTKRSTGEWYSARANRIAWELTNGPIPAGMLVCHRCDNPPCCNPTHLFLGTPAENSADMARKGRAKTLRGTQQKDAKLSAASVLEIRASGKTQDELASQFGVSQSLISRIRSRHRWDHLVG
jgi:hypothetical protein